MADTDYTNDKYRRINYFETLKLTEDELQAEQNYHIAARCIQNAVFRGEGIVKGFEILKQSVNLSRISTDPENFSNVLVIKKGLALLNLEDKLGNKHAREIMLNFDLYLDVAQRTISILIDDKFEALDTSNPEGKILQEGLNDIEISSAERVFIYMEPVEVMEPAVITNKFDLLKGDKPLHIVEKCKFVFTNNEIPEGNQLLLVEFSVGVSQVNDKIEIADFILPEGRYAGIQGEQLSVDKVEFHYDAYDHAGNLNSLKPPAHIGTTTEKITDENDIERDLKVLTIRAIDLLIQENEPENGNGEAPTALAIKGDVEIGGDLVLKGNLSVDDEDADGKVEILAETLLIRDNVITLNQVEGNPLDDSLTSGININTNLDSEELTPIAGDNQDVPFFLFKKWGDLWTWVVHDGHSEAGRLTFNLDQGNIDGNNADNAHFHSVLKYGNPPAEALKILEDNILIHSGENKNGVKVSVGGDIRFLSGLLNFTPPGMETGDNSIPPASFLSYDFIFRPGDSDKTRSNSTKLNSILNKSNRHILISAKYSHECVLDKPIVITDRSNISLNAESGILFKAAERTDLSAVFILRGECTNITFKNMTVDSGLTLCRLAEDSDDNNITNLTIQNCRNHSGPENTGYLLTGEASYLQNTVIENCEWNYSRNSILDLQNCTLKGVRISGNRFHVHSPSGQSSPDQDAAVLITFASAQNESPYRETDAVVVTDNVVTTNFRFLSISGGAAERHFRMVDNDITVHQHDMANTLLITNIACSDVSGNLFRSAVTSSSYAFITITDTQEGISSNAKINDNIFLLAGRTASPLDVRDFLGTYTFINNLVHGNHILEDDTAGNTGNIVYDNQIEVTETKA